MGRGRQKAKHQKVARELKYHTSAMDISALERELSGDQVNHNGFGQDEDDDDDDDDDPYAEYLDEDDDED